MFKINKIPVLKPGLDGEAFKFTIDQTRYDYFTGGFPGDLTKDPVPGDMIKLEDGHIYYVQGINEYPRPHLELRSIEPQYKEKILLIGDKYVQVGGML